MTEKTYYQEIDIVKGIAILLVILGHSFCSHPLNLAEKLPLLGEVVRSFQMPLFFVASGFLFSTRGGVSTLLRKKAARLIVPYIAFGLLSICFRHLFSSITNGGEVTWGVSLIKMLNGEYYWFLYTLLLIMIIVQLVRKWWILLCICGLCLCLSFTDFRSLNFMTLGKVAYFLPFFVLGIHIKSNYSSLLSFYQQHKAITTYISTILFALSFVKLGEGIGIVITQYICPLLGIIIVWIASKEIADRSWKIRNVFVHFGHYSLQYYLNHLLIMLPFYILASKISECHPLIPLLLIFSCAVVTSFVMLRIELQTKCTRFLCGLK
ncbi:MAG: acyltransferase family protein [Bacteroidaceae bacterium]|nr:acyltransferase family protein [Bacteroidaceae bacterium]